MLVRDGTVETLSPSGDMSPHCEIAASDERVMALGPPLHDFAAGGVIVGTGDAAPPKHSVEAGLAHSVRARDGTDIGVDGAVLMRDRRLLSLDEERIINEAERRATRIVGESAEEGPRLSLGVPWRVLAAQTRQT